MLAVEAGEMSQIRISITQLRHVNPNKVLHNKELKGDIAACYKSWLYEYL